MLSSCSGLVRFAKSNFRSKNFLFKEVERTVSGCTAHDVPGVGASAPCVVGECAVSCRSPCVVNKGVVSCRTSCSLSSAVQPPPPLLILTKA